MVTPVLHGKQQPKGLCSTMLHSEQFITAHEERSKKKPVQLCGDEVDFVKYQQEEVDQTLIELNHIQ